MSGSLEIRPVRPKTLERLNTRIVEPPEVRNFLLTVLSQRLYRETPPGSTDSQWQDKLGIMVDYFFRGKVMSQIAKKRHVSRQVISERIRKSLKVLWRRHTGRKEPYPYDLTRLSPFVHQIGVMSQRGLTVEDIIRAFAIDSTKLDHARRALKDLEIVVRGKNIELEDLRKNADKTFRTSTDPVVLTEMFEKLGGHKNTYVEVYNPSLPADHRGLLSIRTLMEEAGLSHYKNSKTEEIAELLANSAVKVFVHDDTDENAKKLKRYFLVPASLRERAVEVLTHVKTLKEYSQNPVQQIAGPSSEQIPSLWELAGGRWPALLPIIRAFGIPYHPVAGERLQDLLDKDCPVAVFAREEQNGFRYTFFPKDRQRLIDYLVQKHLK